MTVNCKNRLHTLIRHGRSLFGKSKKVSVNCKDRPHSLIRHGWEITFRKGYESKKRRRVD